MTHYKIEPIMQKVDSTDDSEELELENQCFLDSSPYFYHRVLSSTQE